MAEKVVGLTDPDEFDDAEGEPIDDVEDKPVKSKKSDFMSMTGGLITDINIKVAFLLFIIGVLIFSDVFIDGILRGIGGTVDDQCTTTKGTVIQLTLLSLAYIILDLVVKYGLL